MKNEEVRVVGSNVHTYCTLRYDDELQAYKIILSDHVGRPTRLFLTEEGLAQLLSDATAEYSDRHGFGLFDTGDEVYVVSVYTADGKQIIDFVTCSMWDADSRYRLLCNTKREDIVQVRYAEYVDGRVQKIEDRYINHMLNSGLMGD